MTRWGRLIVSRQLLVFLKKCLISKATSLHQPTAMSEHIQALSMKLFALPKLLKQKRFGKNVINHFVMDTSHVRVKSMELQNEQLLVTLEDESVLCIIHEAKRKKIPAYAKVLTASVKPTLKLLADNSVEYKWLKFPGIDTFNPEIVRQSWWNKFHFVEEDLSQNIMGLRKPQIAAIYNILSHWKVGEGIGTVVMPTGTGKTETMLSALIANRCEKLLVTVPTDPLREQIADKFIELGYLQDKKFNIVESEAHKPIVGILYENFKVSEDLEQFIDKCNVIITTMDLISSGTPEIQRLLAQKISHLFIDEAHHVKAPSWQSFRNLCKPTKVLQFTATPFRNDGLSIDGTFIFNYSLKQAQEDGYFKKINLIQVNEWSNEKADQVISIAAIEQLRSDLEKKFDHILMARCNTQRKANEVFKIYNQYSEFNPVIIHTGISSKERSESKQKIISRESRIVVCVDMLGEGFDLPNLKIAAFHDIRKSLPITLQLAGRFTRTKADNSLGEASIVVNLRDSDVTAELEDFYALGADWNSILPRVSTTRISQEIDFNEFLNGFEDLDSSKIPFQSLTPALSVVVYKNKTNAWAPLNFEEGIPDIENLDYLFHSINRKKQALIVITGKKARIDWGHSKDIYDIVWNLYVVYWETKNNLLFINASDNTGSYRELANALIGEDSQLIQKLDVFKTFFGINRVKLQNVGLKEWLGKNSSFTMKTGHDIEKALDRASTEKAEKAFVFGAGYENGKKVSIGCSYKGRIWSRSKADIHDLTEWCDAVGKKVIRDDIDPNIILRDTLTPNSVSTKPASIPFAVEWNEFVYLEPETRITFLLDTNCEIFNIDIELGVEIESPEYYFNLVTPDQTVKLRIKLFNRDDYNDFQVEVLGNPSKPYFVQIGKKQIAVETFFYEYPPTFWLVDGSSICGNDYVQLKQLIKHYPKDQIIGRKWPGVDISKEAQGIEPKITDSIQYHIIQELKQADFDIIYDDDYSGEIADIITIRADEEKINIQLYHLKYGKGGKANTRIDNLYEVCGQAMKSVNWVFKDSKEFFGHLMRREIKKRKGKQCSRIELGTKEKLIQLKDWARRKFPVEFEIFIIQPGLSASTASIDQLTLLGVVESYIKERANIRLTVISSE